MKWYIALWIACLWACNPIHGVKVSGDLLHYKGDKLYFEICGQDTTITVALDSTGNFETILPLKEAGYVRSGVTPLDKKAAQTLRKIGVLAGSNTITCG